MLDKFQAGLQCWLHPDQPPDRAYHYRLVARTLVADVPLAPLAPFAIAEPALPTGDPPRLTGPGQFICRNTGWIADAWREVRVWRHEQGLRVQVERVGEFAVTRDGPAVTGSEAATATATALAESLLGAPLVLALALQGIWCLHAGAAMVSGSVIAFAGESGTGKSTLAEYLNAAGEGGWRRVADDTLPVSFGPSGLVALPHFPQFKLTDVEQYPVNATSRLPLAAVYVVGPQSAGQDSVSPQRLGQRQAMQALIRHTVAARLFDKPLLAAHLDSCAEAAARIPVWRLAYPHRRELLPQVREAIHRSLSGSPAGSDSRVAIARAGK